MPSGRYDGSDRDDYFQGLMKNRAGEGAGGDAVGGGVSIDRFKFYFRPV
jgi:hypothetical protein